MGGRTARKHQRGVQRRRTLVLDELHLTLTIRIGKSTLKAAGSSSLKIESIFRWASLSSLWRDVRANSRKKNSRRGPQLPFAKLSKVGCRRLEIPSEYFWLLDERHER